MPKAMQRLRFAVGVYQRPAELCAPASALDRAGVLPAQLGVLCPATAVSELRRPDGISPADWRRIEQLLGQAQPLPTFPALPPLIASPYIAAHVDESFAWQPLRTLKPPHSVAPPPPDLQSLLCDGCLALTVNALTAEQHRQSIRILLSSSPFPVETHEIGPRVCRAAPASGTTAGNSGRRR